MTRIAAVEYTPDELATIYLVEANRSKPTHGHSPQGIAAIGPFISRYLETLDQIDFSNTETFVSYCNRMLYYALHGSTGILEKNPFSDLINLCEEVHDLAVSKVSNDADVPLKSKKLKTARRPTAKEAKQIIKNTRKAKSIKPKVKKSKHRHPDLPRISDETFKFKDELLETKKGRKVEHCV